ncbi:MAG: hypothetical protein ACOCV8_03150 [Spirochaetota bacterium]
MDRAIITKAKNINYYPLMWVLLICSILALLSFFFKAFVFYDYMGENIDIYAIDILDRSSTAYINQSEFSLIKTAIITSILLGITNICMSLWQVGYSNARRMKFVNSLRFSLSLLIIVGFIYITDATNSTHIVMKDTIKGALGINCLIYIFALVFNLYYGVSSRISIINYKAISALAMLSGCFLWMLNFLEVDGVEIKGVNAIYFKNVEELSYEPLHNIVSFNLAYGVLSQIFFFLFFYNLIMNMIFLIANKTYRRFNLSKYVLSCAYAIAFTLYNFYYLESTIPGCSGTISIAILYFILAIYTLAAYSLLKRKVYSSEKEEMMYDDDDKYFDEDSRFFGNTIVNDNSNSNESELLTIKDSSSSRNISNVYQEDNTEDSKQIPEEKSENQVNKASFKKKVVSFVEEDEEEYSIEKQKTIKYDKDVDKPSPEEIEVQSADEVFTVETFDDDDKILKGKLKLENNNIDSIIKEEENDIKDNTNETLDIKNQEDINNEIESESDMSNQQDNDDSQETEGEKGETQLNSALEEEKENTEDNIDIDDDYEIEEEIDKFFLGLDKDEEKEYTKDAKDNEIENEIKNDKDIEINNIVIEDKDIETKSEDKIEETDSSKISEKRSIKNIENMEEENIIEEYSIDVKVDEEIDKTISTYIETIELLEKDNQSDNIIYYRKLITNKDTKNNPQDSISDKDEQLDKLIVDNFMPKEIQPINNENFYSLLSYANKKEFLELFVNPDKLAISRVPQYIIGGDNSLFFAKVLNYIDVIAKNISLELMLVIYEYVISLYNKDTDFVSNCNRKLMNACILSRKKGALNVSEELCVKEIKLMLKRDLVKTMPVIKQLILIYINKKKYEEALRLTETAIRLNFTDNTKGGYEARKYRILALMDKEKADINEKSSD